MRTFAALPLLAIVLVSLCGSPVPPPPSNISGTVFFDANRNGVRDGCDASLPNRHLLLTNDERELEVFASGLGVFEFEDVHSGEYGLSLKADPGTFWPLTTVALGESVVVDLKGSDIEGLEVGAAVTNPLPMGPRVIGFAYHDADANGEVSANECGIAGVSVGPLSPPAEIVRTIDSPGSFQIVSESAPFEPVALIPPGRSTDWWEQTTPPPTAGQCASAVSPAPRYEDGVYELNVGFRLSHGTASVSGVAFLDDDQDTMRDAGEQAIDASIRLTVDCAGEYKPSIFTSSLGEDGYAFRGLPAGSYVIRRDRVGGEGMDPLPAPILAEWRLQVAEGEAIRADYPFRLDPAGTLFVYSYFDSNANGVFDEDPLIRTPPACVRSEGNEQDYCFSTDEVSAGILLRPGTYEVYIPYTSGSGELQTVEIGAGESTNVFFAGNP